MGLIFFILAFLFFFGLSVGSFLNCTIYRISVNEKPKGRSYCPKCKHKLSSKDLIPLLSYIFLKGRCRYCKEKVSLEYPLVELFTGLLFVFVFYFSGFFEVETLSLFVAIDIIFISTVLFFLILIFVYDLKHYIIPDFANFSLIGISFFYLTLLSFLESSWEMFFSGLFSALGVFLFFFLLFYFTKGKGMGFGDVKFVVFMGFFLGFPNILVALFISFFLGAIIGLALISIKKKKIKSQVPFAPFLIVGTLVAFLFGERIVDFYLTYALYY